MSDLFISYAHEDTEFVDRLRTALTEAGRDVWLDVGGIEPGDRWRMSAHEAIDRSDTLLFVISRHSLASEPCLGELAHATAANKRVIPVCVDETAADMDKPDALGELSWIMMRPGDDFAAGVAAIGHALDTDLEIVRAHTRILVRAKAWELAGRRTSPLLRGEELRSAEQWLTRAAGSGSRPTELQQDFIAASRHAATRRSRTVTGVALVVATVAIVLSIFALIERSRAITQASIATSRQVAAVSESSIDSNLNAALLLAVQAYHQNPNAQSRAALLQADLSSPHLSRFVTMGAQISALAASNSWKTVVAGLINGQVVQWTEGRSVVLGSLGASVSSLGVSSDGQTVVAAAGSLLGAHGSRALLWHGGHASYLTCPAPETPDAVGLSPSGATALVHCGRANGSSTQSILVVNGVSGLITANHAVSGSDFHPADLVVSSDRTALLFDGNLGPWQVRSIPGWTLQSSSKGVLGAHQGLSGFSSGGQFVTATNDDPTIPVWPTDRPTNLFIGSSPYTAQAPINAASALTLSPRAGLLAVGDSGTIYVAKVLAVKANHPSPVILPGNGSINPNTLSFAGNDAHLLSASASTISLWNLDQYDRLEQAQTTNLPSPCNGCNGALIAVSPNGSRIAAVADNGGATVLQNLGQGPGRLIQSYSFGPPVWDGSELLLPATSPPAPGVSVALPADVRVLKPDYSGESIVADGLIDGGRKLAIVDDAGNVFLRSPRSGGLLHKIPGPHDLTVHTGFPLFQGEAAVDPGTGLVALDDNGAFRLVNTQLGGGSRVIARGAGASSTGFVTGGVAFGGSRLFIERPDGTLEVWNARGTVRERVITGDSTYAPYAPVVDPTGNLIARQRLNGTVSLVDANSGAILATLSAPASPQLGLRVGLAFTPRGEELVSVIQTLTGTVHAISELKLDPATLVRAACTAAGRGLTDAEWRQLIGTTPPSGPLACAR